MQNIIHRLVQIVLVSVITICSALAGTIHGNLTPTFDPAKRYLFFLHGRIIEKMGDPATSKRYGEYRYRDTLQAFSSAGLEVISEARGKTYIHDYSAKIAADVGNLLAAGVPPGHITVAGFSKGGRMTLVVSSLLANSGINYVVLAGCRSSDIEDLALKPAGRILSIYDANDDSFGSCGDIFSSVDTGLESREIVLQTGSGHGVFYDPTPDWIQPMIEWIKH